MVWGELEVSSATTDGNMELSKSRWRVLSGIIA